MGKRRLYLLSSGDRLFRRIAHRSRCGVYARQAAHFDRQVYLTEKDITQVDEFLT